MVRLRWVFGVLLLLLGFPGLNAAAQGTPVPAGGGTLFVADPAAQALYAYALPDLALTATLDGVAMNTHAGFLPLPDGRLLLIDDAADDLLAVRRTADALEVVGRVDVPEDVTHLAVDPGLTYAIVGAVSDTAALTLVDLTAYTATSLPVEAGEAGVMIGDDPLTVYHRNDAALQVEAYPVNAFLAGDTTPSSAVPTGAFGHGEAIDHARGRLYLATDDGVDVVGVSADGLQYETTWPWAASGREGGRAYFARLTPDGSHFITYIANRAGEETAWGEWSNDLYLVDLETDAVTRSELAPGVVFRFALADNLALFFALTPAGDQAILVDADPASATFGQTLTTIPLAPLSNGPQAGQSPWEAESRIAALTPDGATGFVSHGGDGVISVIDTQAGVVSQQLAVPTSLAGGGYMIAVDDDMPFVDTVAR